MNRLLTHSALLAVLEAATLIVWGERLPMRLYTVSDGLAGHQINCIVQDSHGFMWFCTEEGLSRFDGYQFRNFGSAQGLPGAVFDLLEAPDGLYWVTAVRGVYHFNPASPGQSS